MNIELQKLFDAHHEWLLVHRSGESFALQKTEIELEFSQAKTLLTFPDERGFQTWRVAGFESVNEEIHLDLSRNFDREHEKIRFVPRVLASTLTDAIELVRSRKAEKIAAILKLNFPKIKILRVALNKGNGRFAEIVFANSRGAQTAVSADVSDDLTVEIMISTAILRLTKLAARRKNPIDVIWIVGEKKQTRKLQKLHALLRKNWQGKVIIKEFCRESDSEKSFDNLPPKIVLNELPVLQFADLWRGKQREIKTVPKYEQSETARKIIELAPDEIDSIFTRNGETLRFQGLPFARIRKIGEVEKIWCGVEKIKQILNAANLDEFGELIGNLKTFRRYDSPNKRHAFFQTAPEAWLEAVLRRNIKLLDANLILSPVYHQFRAERDKIDLLALRQDGRLVIIELKTAADREMIYQAADYWRKIERERRLGNLDNINLFNSLEIADKPVIVYLAAPTLSFHRDFDFFAATISDEIEIHRFNLAENWRDNLKVLERKRLGER